MSEFRLRIGFSKRGRAAHLSHLEMLHAVERMVRRAGLPFAISQGYHPHMKLAFGPALSVGVASTCEYADVFLTEFIAPDKALEKLQHTAPTAFTIIKCGFVHPKEASLTASITILSYCAEIEALDIEVREIERRFNELRASDSLEVEHKGKTKVLNPSQCIANSARVSQEGNVTKISFDLRISPSGSMKPDVLLNHILDLPSDKRAQLTLTRTGLFIETKEGLVPPL